jgi:hypothetical protein
MKTMTQAWEDHIKHCPNTSTEQDYFEAGWKEAIESAAQLVEDYLEIRSYLRAGEQIKKELTK